jgi:hypothetical protein
MAFLMRLFELSGFLSWSPQTGGYRGYDKFQEMGRWLIGHVYCRRMQRRVIAGLSSIRPPQGCPPQSLTSPGI